MQGTQPIYAAVEIAIEYFAAKGIDDPCQKYGLVKDITDMFKEGERRPLMLANRAIEKRERQTDVEKELKEQELFASFYPRVS
jgi:hypothetical protein